MAASPQRRGFLPSAASFSSLRKGHSRFSKALPSIPLEEHDESNSSSSSNSSRSNSNSNSNSNSRSRSKPEKAGRPTPPWRSPTYTLSNLLSAASSSPPPLSSPPPKPHQKPRAAVAAKPPPQQQSSSSSSSPPSKDNKTLPPTPSTSPRLEIWPRRSNKPENLSLNRHSHSSDNSSSSRGGSTATFSSAAEGSPPPLPHAGPDAVTSPPGRPAVSLLKKKKKKKKEKKENSPPTAENQAMGSESSKLSLVKKSLHRRRSDDVKTKSKTDKIINNIRPVAQRPPTPEYGIEDTTAAPAGDITTTTTTTTFVTPVSPAPSESPRMLEALKASSPPNLVARKPLPYANPSLDALVGLDGAALQTTTPPPPPSPRGRGWSFRASDSTESVGFVGSRSVSSRLDLQRQDTERPRRTTMDGGDPRLVQSETQGLLFRGRDGTLYPEMKVTREPHESASYFPIQTDRLPDPGAVIPAGPLKDSHYGCYQGHRTMNRRQNRHYPLTCQTCDKADTDDRWACIFCNLRICETCMRALNSHHRVLRRLVDELALNTPLSLSSMSRPGSALGMPPGKVF